MRCWKDGSVLKSMDYSWNRPKFGSQHSESPVGSDLRDQIPSGLGYLRSHSHVHIPIALPPLLKFLPFKKIKRANVENN